MGRGYAVAYRLGLTPWEKAGEAASESFARLLDREERDRTPPFGRALDIGCGTGAHTHQLADRGWQAVGIDDIGRAVDRAREGDGSSSATFVVGDATDLVGSGIGADVEFFLDIGCFHGLTDEQREAYGRSVTTVATPTATLLVFAFRPGHRVGLPRGADQTGLERAFPGWAVLAVEDADTSGMPALLKRSAVPKWFRLRRQ